jgi:divalent metal cation (Fe/Co/Zn/Cd) transporter
VLKLLQKHHPLMGWHHVHATPYGSGYAITLHVTLPAQIKLEDAHRVAERAEMLVRTTFPKVGRVTIHTEPEEDPNAN